MIPPTAHIEVEIGEWIKTIDELEELRKRVAELEEMMKPKSCSTCKWDDLPFPSNAFHCDECKHAYSCYNDNFEPKEQ